MNKKICLENLHNILNANNITMSGLTATKQLLYKEDKEPVEYGLINLLIIDGNEEIEIADVVLRVFGKCEGNFDVFIDEEDEGLSKLYEGLDLGGDFIPEVITLLSGDGRLVYLESIEVAEDYRNIGIATNIINMLPDLVKDLFGNIEGVLALNALAFDYENEEEFLNECVHLSEYFNSLGFEIGTDEFTLYKII